MKLYKGVIEDNNHPNKNGMVKVRIFGIHTENNENSGEFESISTDQLPWAEVLGGTEFGLVSGIGTSNILRNGTWVYVVLDNDDQNKPIVIGVIKGVNSTNSTGQYSGGLGFCDPSGEYPIINREEETDLNRLSTNEKLSDAYYADGSATIHKQINDTLDSVSKNDGVSGADVSQDEPVSLNDKSVYPDVSILETHSGHVIEIDDTDGNERLRLYHTTGSYIEIKPDGTFVQKSVNTDSINHYIHMSNVNEHIVGSIKKYLESNIDEIVDGYIKRKYGATLDEHIVGEVKRQLDNNLIENIDGNVTITIGGNLTWDVGGNISISSGGTHTVENGGNHSITAPRIDLN